MGEGSYGSYFLTLSTEIKLMFKDIYDGLS